MLNGSQNRLAVINIMKEVHLLLYLKHTDQFLHEAISLFQSMHSIDEAHIIYYLSIPTECVGTGNQNQITPLIIIHCLGVPTN